MELIKEQVAREWALKAKKDWLVVKIAKQTDALRCRRGRRTTYGRSIEDVQSILLHRDQEMGTQLTQEKEKLFMT